MERLSRPAGDAESGGEVKERPTPVRAVMGASGPAPSQEEGTSSRILNIGDEEWIARVIGSGRSGTAPSAGAPLLLVVFALALEPEKHRREAIAVGESLDDLSHHDLEGLFARAKPYRTPDGQGTVKP